MNSAVTEAEAYANIASMAADLESFAQKMSLHKIEIMPITMIGSPDDIPEEEYEEREEAARMHQCPDCPGCMDCLGFTWRDFL